MALLIFYLLLTMGISFLCSLLESVLMSTPISYITMKQDDGDRNAALFLRMKQDPDRPLSAILSLNTIANTLGAAAVGHQATLLSGEHWFGIISAAMTLLILVFSEIVPKSIGTSHWKDLLWLAKIMQLLVYLLYPVVWIIEKLHNSISDEEPDTAISREEVSAMANIGEEEGVLDNSENKVIQNIIKLRGDDPAHRGQYRLGKYHCAAVLQTAGTLPQLPHPRLFRLPGIHHRLCDAQRRPGVPDGG